MVVTDKGEGVVGESFRGSSVDWVDALLSMMYLFSVWGVIACMAEEEGDNRSVR